MPKKPSLNMSVDKKNVEKIKPLKLDTTIEKTIEKR